MDEEKRVLEVLDHIVRETEEIGFGHVIAHLKAAWRDGLCEETATIAADVKAYPRKST